MKDYIVLWEIKTKDFGNVILDNLRATKDGRALLVIDERENINKALKPYFDAVTDEEFDSIPAFSVMFTGNDADVARQTVTDFLKSEPEESEYTGLILAARDTDGIYPCAHLTFAGDSSEFQTEQRRKAGIGDDEKVWFLPLRVLLSECPVCRKRRLFKRNYNHICVECGWEDDPFDLDPHPELLDENGVPIPTDDYDGYLAGANNLPIDVYRYYYLALKKEKPDYTWGGEYLRARGHSIPFDVYKYYSRVKENRGGNH